MERFFEGIYWEFLRRACHPVFGGDVVHEALDICGIGGAERWEHAALIRYRSRRDMMEIVPTLLQRYEFKLGALEKHIAFPVETRLYLGDPRLLLGLALLAGTAVCDLLLVRR